MQSRHSAFTVRVETIKAGIVALGWWGTQLKAFLVPEIERGACL